MQLRDSEDLPFFKSDRLLDYQPRHIKALGFITREHALQADDALLAARNRHVQGLQQLPGCADFGEVLA